MIRRILKNSMQKVMKVSFLVTQPLARHRVFNKRTKTVMESINVVIDDAITKVAIDDNGEGPSSKETTVEVEVQDVEEEGLTLEKESTPVNSRMEIRSMCRSSSPLTPLKVHPPIS